MNFMKGGKRAAPADFCLLQPAVAAFSSTHMQHRNRSACYADSAKQERMDVAS